MKAKLFRGFADPSRLSIVETIGTTCLTVTEIVAETGLSQPNVSNHLSCLLDCGLVEREQRGRFVHYWLSDLCVVDVLAAVGDMLTRMGSELDACPRYESAADADS